MSSCLPFFCRSLTADGAAAKRAFQQFADCGTIGSVGWFSSAVRPDDPDLNEMVGLILDSVQPTDYRVFNKRQHHASWAWYCCWLPCLPLHLYPVPLPGRCGELGI